MSVVRGPRFGCASPALAPVPHPGFFRVITQHLRLSAMLGSGAHAVMKPSRPRFVSFFVEDYDGHQTLEVDGTREVRVDHGPPASFPREGTEAYSWYLCSCHGKLYARRASEPKGFQCLGCKQSPRALFACSCGIVSPQDRKPACLWCGNLAAGGSHHCLAIGGKRVFHDAASCPICGRLGQRAQAPTRPEPAPEPLPIQNALSLAASSGELSRSATSSSAAASSRPANPPYDPHKSTIDALPLDLQHPATAVATSTAEPSPRAGCRWTGEVDRAMDDARNEIRGWLVARRALLGHIFRSAVIAGAGLWGAYYLFWPLLQPRSTLLAQRNAGPAIDALDAASRGPFDLYVASDASGSVDQQIFDATEKGILAAAPMWSNDRSSYCRFGSSTLPHDVEPASGRDAIASPIAVGEVAKISGKTDFAMLFDHIWAGINRERRADAVNAAAAGQPRPDLVLILSDGIPDTGARPGRCPPAHGDDFIDQNIRDSFRTLVTYPYPAKGKVVPVLILAGGRSSCPSGIEAAWKSSLGGLGLNVLSYSRFKSPNAVWNAVLGVLKGQAGVDRTPRLYMRPVLAALEGEQRSNLMGGRNFSARFEAFSYFDGVMAHVKWAAIFDSDNNLVTKLAVVDDPDNFSFLPESRAEIFIDKPKADNQCSDIKTKKLWFKFDSKPPGLYEDYAGYEIRFELDSPVAWHADKLTVGRKMPNLARRALVQRAKRVAYVISALLLLFFGTMLVFARWPAMWRPLRLTIYRVVIAPQSYWAAAWIVQFALVFFSWVCIIDHPWSFFVAPILAASILAVAKFCASISSDKTAAPNAAFPKEGGSGGEMKEALTASRLLLFLEFALLPILEWAVVILGSRLVE